MAKIKTDAEWAAEITFDKDALTADGGGGKTFKRIHHESAVVFGFDGEDDKDGDAP